MTMAELFEAMPARLNSAAAAKVNKTVQWNITGDDPGVWAIQINDGTARLVPGGVEKPDVTFTIMSKDWQTIAEGKLNAMNAFMTGNMGLAMKVPQFLPLDK
jgi:putative sterol carrier protein